MGVTAATMSLWIQMARDGLIPKNPKMFELGSQDMEVTGYPELITEFTSILGQEVEVEEAKRFERSTCLAFFKDRLGWDYHCSDVNTRPGVIRLDLNFDSPGPEHIGQYDFVTNHGLTEHIFNQVNCFKVMHDLTKPGGYMYHIVPFHGAALLNQCFFSYHPEGFYSLARANGYKVLGTWISPYILDPTLAPYWKGFFKHLELKEPGAANLVVLLQRPVVAVDFKMPFQHEQYEGEQHPDNAARYQYTSFNGEIISGQLAQEIAVRKKIGFDPENMHFKTAFKMFLKEGWRRLKGKMR